MTREEVIEQLLKVKDKDPQLAQKMYEFWKEDNTRSIDDLQKLAGKSFKDLVERETGKTRRPVTEAFGVNEDKYLDLINPDSPTNWMHLGSSELKKAAINGGYMKDLPKNATEEEKLEQRRNFGNFLRMLADESTLQGRRNAVREYENTKFTEDPLGWAQVGINKLFNRTYNKRAKEQAMRGEGASSFGDMSAQDRSTLGTDVGVNALLGAGAGGIGRGLAGLGAGTTYGLRTFGNVAGADLAAGVLGGLGEVYNRGRNTREGVQPYEYLTEPAMTGMINVLATPAMARQAINSGAQLIGLGAAKLGGKGKRGVLNWAQKWADQKYTEPMLANTMRDMERNLGRTAENSPMSAETKNKIDEMFNVLNDGATPSPNKNTSLFDELQALYEKAGREGTNLKGEVKNLDVGSPEPGRFRTILDQKIADLEGALKNSAGAEEAPALQRELSYFRNFRDMMDNGLIDAEEYLYKTDPVRKTAPKSNYVSNPSTIDDAVFELGKAANREDFELMKDFIQNVKMGMNVNLDNGMAQRLNALAQKYPEFKRYYKSLRTMPGYDYSFWPSLGISKTSGGVKSTEALGHTADNGARMVYGENGLLLGNGAFLPGMYKKASGTPKGQAKDILKYVMEDAVGDVVKPAVTEARLMKYDKPDNSLDALERQFNELRSRKPVATDAALSWKFDPSLPSQAQLTMEERDLIDRYREAKRQAVLGQ